MKRRAFIAGLGSAVAWPLRGLAQVSERKRRVIGVLGGASGESARPQTEALLQGLAEYGYVEGTDYELRWHWANGDMQRLPELALAVVRLNPDLILAAPTPAAVAAKAATNTIPIVCFMLADEVRLGLVASDARPGGNVTGLAMRLDGMAGKQLEIATELLPGAKNVGILVNVASSDASTQLSDVAAVSAALKINSIVAKVIQPDDVERAFQFLASERVSTIVVLYDALFFQQRRQIAALVDALRLPAIYGARDHVTEGGLMSYGVSLRANAHRAAFYLDRIFKGQSPGDLPVEFPTKLELVINLRAAKTLNLDIPPQLLARANEVIE